MKQTVFDGDLNQCYGCGACSQICPKYSIKMESNAEGFLIPLVDNNTCIECNMCHKVCPVIKQNLIRILNPLSAHVYAAWNNDLAQVMESTSAAIFPLLAETVLSKGGAVYGCAWAEDELRAVQIRITSQSDLHKLKGSKYVQSSTETTFTQVKIDLNNSNFVLYSGTPCQIAGLRLFLQNDYENLFLVDLVCHGVPSPKILSAYVSYIEGKEKCKITSLKFRDKKKSGFRSYISWINTNTGRKSFRVGGLESYLYGYYNEYYNRESCYMCKFSSSHRPGDITLSDFWGIEKLLQELKRKRKYGLSMVMCNSTKGKDLLSSIKHKITCISTNLEYAQIGDKRLMQNGKRPVLREQSYRDLSAYGFTYMANSYLRPKYYFIRRLIPSWAKNIILEF